MARVVLAGLLQGGIRLRNTRRLLHDRGTELYFLL